MFGRQNKERDLKKKLTSGEAVTEDVSEVIEEPVNKKKEWISNIIYIVVVIAITACIICFVGQRTCVDGDSMYPTLHHGDNLIVDKISYNFTDPQRNDVIIFPYPGNEKIYYIKRIIGLPGETIQIDYDGNIYINGEILVEERSFDAMVYPGIAEEPILLGDDEYFVLGDNRNMSNDSRSPSVGVIRGDDIVGRAWVRFFPFSDAGLVKNIK